jgi:ATP-dependent Clp endopeptidase proteolytic subunit ClpP
MAESSIPPELIEQNKRKLEAEVAKLKAETESAEATRKRDDEKARLEGLKLQAEAELLEVQRDVMRAQVRGTSAQADAYLINTERERQKWDYELAQNRYHRVYHFTDPVTEESVSGCMNQINRWTRGPGAYNSDGEARPIEIVFTSPGGHIIDGMALYDFIQQVRRQGFRITTGALGMAASMAGILLQAGDTRYMSKESWLLIHEAQFGALGKMGEVEDTVEWVKKIQEHILDIFAARSKLSKTQIKTKWTRKDWWLPADEALRHGFIDETR